MSYDPPIVTVSVSDEEGEVVVAGQVWEEPGHQEEAHHQCFQRSVLCVLPRLYGSTPLVLPDVTAMCAS